MSYVSRNVNSNIFCCTVNNNLEYHMVPYVHILFYGINIAAKMNDIRNFVQAVKRK